MYTNFRSIYLDGNYRAAQVVSNAGYDVLDISFYMRDHSLYPLRVYAFYFYTMFLFFIEMMVFTGELLEPV